MCPPKAGGKGEALPAILDLQLSDYLSLLLCGYIGARCVLLKYPALPHAGGTWLLASAASLVTAFGGGTGYALLARWRRPGRPFRFAWQDPSAVACVLVGLTLGFQLAPGCWAEEALGMGCGTAFGYLDAANNAVLIAWGSSKPEAQADWTGNPWAGYPEFVMWIGLEV
ncbi:unnamed protein product [Effrenium voratum]|uniref:Uncharacterized protein n=1 Tax=Effrenium voratum TaxID=2562239 RepID=A0AA36MFW9_9DINO|nr:unnamed protein product [Effrenium voratum]